MMRLLILASTIVIAAALSTLAETITAPEGWFPFPIASGESGPASFFHNPSQGNPAIGSRVTVNPNGHFAADGTRVRFWGAAVTGSAAFPTAAEAEQIAQELAKLGFNLVVFHMIDASLLDELCGDLKSAPLDKLDYFIAKLKEQGIYVSLPFYERFVFRACDGIQDWTALNAGEMSRRQIIGLFDPNVVQLQKDYATDLLSHTNPYTGFAYKDDPVIAFVKLANEISLFVGWPSDQLNYDPGDPGDAFKVTEYYSDQLDARFNAWLVDKYETRAALETAWHCDGKDGLLPTEDPLSGTVERLLYEDDVFPQYCWERWMDTIRFYYWLESQYLEDVRDYLRSTLGTEVLVGGINNYYGMPSKIAVSTRMDFMTQNLQWEHPWDYSTGISQLPIRFLNTPMANAERGTDLAPAGPWDMAWIETRNTLYKGAFVSAFEGQPVVISEYNHHFPNEYQAEFPITIATYGALQDWDGIVVHEYAATAARGDSVNSFFQFYNNPVLLAQMPVASRVFRDGLVSVALSETIIPYGIEESLEQFFKCMGDPYAIWYWPNCCSYSDKRSLDMHLPLVNRVRNRAITGLAPVEGPMSAGGSPYESDTGELAWNIVEGTILVDAPYVQGAIGRIGGDPIVLPQLEIELVSDFAAVGLVSLDAKPLTTSSQMLLTTTGRVTTPGISISHESGWEASGFYGCSPCWLDDWGTGTDTSLVEPVVGTITLVLPGATGVQVHCLDETGNIDAAVNVDKTGTDRFTFSIGNGETLWYGITVERLESSARFRVNPSGDVLADGTFFASAFYVGSADIAEWVTVSEPVEPGDVLAIDPHVPGAYRKSRDLCSSLVVGAVSSGPGLVLGAHMPTGEQALLALAGIVPVKVTDEGGDIEPGDLLVSSSTPGYAMRWTEDVGCLCNCSVVGKALESSSGAAGTVLVLLASS